jgi:hypothetical protein
MNESRGSFGICCFGGRFCDEFHMCLIIREPAQFKHGGLPPERGCK